MDPRAVLACGRCGARGPHRTFVYRAGGLSTLCRPCTLDEESQDAGQHIGDSFHGSNMQPGQRPAY